MHEMISENGAILPGFDGFNSEDLDVLTEAARRRKAELNEMISENGAILPGFDGFSGEELDELIEAARRRKAELKAKELDNLHQLASRVKAEASHLGINLYTLLDLKPPTIEKGESRKICYRHPDKPYTWTGRGPKPGWFKELIAAGASIESLMVDPVTL